MKPSPLLLKAGLVVGLGVWALVPPAVTAAELAGPCDRLSTGLVYCPIEPELVCAQHSCPVSQVSCWIDDGEAIVSCYGWET